MSTQFRNNNFDLLRLFAATQVVITHACEHLALHPKEGQWAWLYNFIGMFPGVPIFFVISGFLISKSYESRRNDLRSYAVNRGLRIYPALWICFGTSLIAMMVLGALSTSQVASPSFLAYIFGQLTFAQFYTPGFLRPYGTGNPNGSLWTIPVELQFYVALPVIYWAGKRLTQRTFDWLLIAAMVASFASIALVHRPETTTIKLFSITFIPHIWLFLVGVLIQRNFTNLSTKLVDKGLYWLAAFIVARCAVSPLNSWVAESLTHVVLAVTVISLAYTCRDASRKILREVDMSYGVYLYHMVIINILVETGHVGPGLPVVLAFAATGLLAFLSFKFIERPSLSLKGKFLKTAQTKI